MISGQLWKLIDGKFVNKSNIWKSNDKWSFKPAEGTMVYIENVSKSKVLGTENDLVIEEKFVENKREQIWEISKEGVVNSESYFTLKNLAIQKILTAVSAKKLELKDMLQDSKLFHCSASY